MYEISKQARDNIKRIVGIDVNTIKKMSFDEQENWVKNRCSAKNITFSRKKRKSIIGRGNPLLARRKFRTMEDLDKKSKKYIGI